MKSGGREVPSGHPEHKVGVCLCNLGNIKGPDPARPFEFSFFLEGCQCFSSPVVREATSPPLLAVSEAAGCL